jgi:hypothetical protein
VLPIPYAQPAIEIVVNVLMICSGLVAIFGPAIFIAVWILSPIDRAAKSREAPVRFSVGDFLCLFVIIQIPLAVVFRGGTDDWREGAVIVAVLLGAVGCVIWYAGARTLSKAGVSNTWLRFVYLGPVLSLVYYGLIPYTMLSAMQVGWAFDREEHGEYQWGTGTWLLLTLLYGLCAAYTRWMLDKARPEMLELPAADLIGTTTDYAESTSR